MVIGNKQAVLSGVCKQATDYSYCQEVKEEFL